MDERIVKAEIPEYGTAYFRVWNGGEQGCAVDAARDKDGGSFISRAFSVIGTLCNEAGQLTKARFERLGPGHYKLLYDDSVLEELEQMPGPVFDAMCDIVQAKCMNNTPIDKMVSKSKKNSKEHGD